MRGDVVKTWLYAAASIVGGAWIAPWVYNAGKALAEISLGRHTNGLIEWLADKSRDAGFSKFYEVSLLGVAALLFLPYAASLRCQTKAIQDGNWSIRLPQGANDRRFGQPLRKNPRGPWHLAAGFFVVAALFAGIATVLVFTMALDLKTLGNQFFQFAGKALVGSFALAALQEILFCGVAMGIFLRVFRPATAMGMTALFFAVVMAAWPPAGLGVADPEAAGVGFELLRKTAASFCDLHVLLRTFAPLLTLGAVLAYARWRTASLWLPIGLHAGVLFVNAVVPAYTTFIGSPTAKGWALAGPSLEYGLVPLAGILAAGLLTAGLISTPDADSPA